MIVLLFACLHVDAVYPIDDPYKKVELGLLDQVLEGEFRPGHFDGVAHVVHNLMYFSGPSKAYFGLKDVQQLSVINHMVNKLRSCLLKSLLVKPCEMSMDWH